MSSPISDFRQTVADVKQDPVVSQQKCGFCEGWFTATWIKLTNLFSGDKGVAQSIFSRLMDKSGPSIDGKTLRWFSSDQLNLVKKELANVTDFQVYGITDTGKIQTVFKSAIYFADQNHHSEDKQRSLVEIFQAVTARVSHPAPQPHHVTHASPSPTTTRVSVAATHGLHPSPGEPLDAATELEAFYKLEEIRFHKSSNPQILERLEEIKTSLAEGAHPTDLYKKIVALDLRIKEEDLLAQLNAIAAQLAKPAAPPPNVEAARENVKKNIAELQRLVGENPLNEIRMDLLKKKADGLSDHAVLARFAEGIKRLCETTDHSESTLRPKLNELVDSLNFTAKNVTDGTPIPLSSAFKQLNAHIDAISQLDKMSKQRWYNPQIKERILEIVTALGEGLQPTDLLEKIVADLDRHFMTEGDTLDKLNEIAATLPKPAVAIEDEQSLIDAIRNKDLAALDHVSESLRDDPDTMLKALQAAKEAPGMLLERVDLDQTVCGIVSDTLKDNEDFLLKANKVLPSLLMSASERVKEKADFWIKVIQDGGSTSGMHYSLKDNEKVQLELAKHQPTEFAPGKDLRDNPKFMLEVIAIHPFLILRADKLKTDLNFLVDAAKIDPKVLDHVSDDMKAQVKKRLGIA